MNRVFLRSVQFLTIVFWWLALVPAFSVSSWCASTASLLLLCAVTAYFFKLRLFAVLFYIPSVLLPLWFTKGMWIMPAAVYGLCLTFLIFFLMLEHPENTPKFEHTEQYLRMPPRLYIFMAVWLSGLILFSFFQTENTPIIFLIWSCLMLFSGSRESRLFINREWFGYMTRRNIFVSQKKWKIRFFISGIAVILWIAVCCGISKLAPFL